MDGGEGPRAQATRAFMRNFSAMNATPFAFWDERLSTAAVNRSLIEQDVSRARRAAVVDRMAAAYILQGALDRLAAIGAHIASPPNISSAPSSAQRLISQKHWSENRV